MSVWEEITFHITRRRSSVVIIKKKENTRKLRPANVEIVVFTATSYRVRLIKSCKCHFGVPMGGRLKDYMLNFWDFKVFSSSLLFISPTAAAIRRADLRLQELEGKCTLFMNNITERTGERGRRERSRVSFEYQNSQSVVQKLLHRHTHTHTHTHLVLLLANACLRRV